MTNAKTTKRALLASVISLLLCMSMLIGSTFAWFTDTDTVSSGHIVSGTLDVEIVDENGDDILEFTNGTTSDILWEPGVTFKTETFHVANNGNLNLKFKLEVNGIKISDNKLNEVISYTLKKADGTIVAELKNSGDSTLAMEDIALAPEAVSDTYYIEAHMSEDAGNDYQGITFTGISLVVYATQMTAEEDVTGPDYDKDATYDDEVVLVKDADGFLAAFANLEEGQIISLTADIDLTGKNWTPVANKGFVLNGNGKTITGMNGALVATTAAKEYTIKNVAFEGLTINAAYGANSEIGFGGAAGLIGYADTCAYILMENVTINNANISGAEYIGGFAGYTSGYNNDNDGAVNASHNFINCVINNSTLTSSTDGSVGGLIGHAGSNPATTTNVSGFSYENLTLTQNEARTDKLGYMIGTCNVGIVNIADAITVENGPEIGYIGRFVPQGTGKLTINNQEVAAFDGKGN